MAKKPLVLIISKDEQSIKTEENLLKKKCRIEKAADGALGLKLAQELSPDLIITDLLLPKIDGFQLLKLLKSNPKTKTTKIMVFSVLLAEDRVLSMGADVFLLKPVIKQVFLDKVNTLLGDLKEAGG